ncbi:8-oxo-dGTP pyrophosphatase MutT (NUDIX family) [Peteryoungia aggregata LMG 23059]|uniref:8-oxo-dGTP pyrophosphatase MutT (NUDIX family) n=1 Tax=Peteryoungia aggregata LMG 23059 TaxID=1368425 RepID=A0ABU0G7S4_9HYPH|nr:NUDIX hydrolase [Peteryoungia aggregata]MDQ0421385.1 8-oxo-dGTP pyrophosphatase MutT (NUDIX family) [Peteryoungia aggregata LMG 23059]
MNGPLIDEVGLPADGSPQEVCSLELRVSPEPHPLDLTRVDEVAENWLRESAANPALFNGKTILQREIRYRNGHLRAEGHVSSFATFLWWRRQRDLAGACHLFGYPVIVSSDGALIAVEMAPHTANPGQVYFAAGSLDLSDVSDGACDIEGNMRREVLEETGLDLNEAFADPVLYASYRPKRLALVRLFSFAETADALVARINTFARTCADPEISRAVVIRNGDLTAYRYGLAMAPILTWFFSDRR